MAHPFYRVNVWNNYLDYSGVLYIVTEVNKNNVVLVDEDSVIHYIPRLLFIHLCFTNYYHKLKK